MPRPMKNLLYCLLLLTAFASETQSLCAVRGDEPLQIERPFLWEIQPPDSQVVSWLFGTIHVNDPQITRLHPQADAAFSAASAVWFEIDFVKDSVAQTEAISLEPGQHLTDFIDKEAVARIDARLRKLSPLLSRQALPEFRVVMWPVILANLEAQMRQLGQLPMDMKLQAAAREANKMSGGLEDPATQLKPLLDLTMDQQREFLIASLDVLDEDEKNNVSQIEALMRLYAKGEAETLYEYLQAELQRPQLSDDLRNVFIDALLLARNERMAVAINERIQADPDLAHFAAVGTAHLLGPGSVQEALEELGYQIRRVEPEKNDTTEP